MRENAPSATIDVRDRDQAADGSRSESRRPLAVSVVIPARDEAATIDVLIRSLLAQSRPAAEILVVDAGSRDDTAKRVRRWGEGAPEVRLVEIGPAYPGPARNAGISAAAYQWVALTDAGIRADPEWLAQLWQAHERRPDAGLVFGHYEPKLRGWLAECATLAYVAPCVRMGERWWRGGSVASMLLDRRLWERCGGFPPFRASEDLIFMEAAAAHGAAAASAPGARVVWEVPTTWSATFRRFAGYSRHNLIAGRGRFWHRGVARLYAAAGAVALVGATVSPMAWALLAAAAAARTVRAVWMRRGGSGVRCPWRPDRLLGVLALLILLDAATAWGALEWLRRDVLGVRKKRSGYGGVRRRGRAAPAHEGATSLCAEPGQSGLP